MTRLRDTFRDQRYFDEQVEYNARKLVEFRAIIADPGTAPDHRRQLRHTVFRRELEQLVARYSRGEPVSELRTAYPRVVAALAEYQAQAGREAHDFGHFDAYVLALWIVALGILLDVDDVTFHRAVEELDNAGRDAIFDRLVALRVGGRAPARALLYPDPYAPLLEALDASGTTRTVLIRRFLDGYYEGMRGAYWHDSHLGEDAGYFGYWCFELAAFVKVLRIDDSAFAASPYYPRDLVHQSARDIPAGRP